MGKRRVAMKAVLAALLLASSGLVTASVPTLAECLEGSDFIANAAQARDNGVSREAFMGRLTEDFVAIRAFPRDLRWFVKDGDDERFLASAAGHVFDAPAPPGVHRAEFLRACFERLSA